MAFYDDEGAFRGSKEEARKRLTLDLNKVNSGEKRAIKKPRFDVLLSSPDLNMLKLPSPELEKLIMQQNGLLSTTPNSSQFLYPNPRVVTHDQEMYGRGFDDALAELHQNGAAAAQAQSVPPSSDNHSNEYPPVTIATAFNTTQNPPATSSFQTTLQVLELERAVYDYKDASSIIWTDDWLFLKWMGFTEWLILLFRFLFLVSVS